MDWKFIVTIVVAIVFGITALVQGLILARKKKPSWAYQTTKVIGLGSNAPPELKLMFGDVLVNELFRTKFIFFNAGKEPILGSDDVVKPITLFLDNAQILQEPLVHPSNNEIVFTAKRVNDRVEINFKYLDHQDGAIIETLHTKSERLDCQGKIIGASKVSYLGRFQQISLTTSDKVMAGLFITCIVTLAITVVLGFRGSLAPNSPLMVISVALGLVSGSGIPPIINFFLSKRFPSWSRQFAPLKDPSQREIKDR